MLAATYPVRAGTYSRNTWPVAFIVAKIDALEGRDKPKDDYDIVWLIESWPGGPAAAAVAFASRPALLDARVAPALTRLGELFADTNSVGARSYARFLAESPVDESLLERTAVGAISEFLAASRNHDRRPVRRLSGWAVPPALGHRWP